MPVAEIFRSSSARLARRFEALAGSLRGAIWMLIAAACLTAMAAAVRHLSAELHTFEIVFFRTMLAIAFMLPWLMRAGLGAMRTTRIGMLGLRGVVTMIASTCYFWGLALIPLADATAIMFTRPLVGAVLAMVLLHEVVRGRRWSAMAVGFIGVLIVLRPAFDEMNAGIAVLLVATVFASVAAVLVRHLARTESPDTITMYYAVSLTLLSAVPAAIVWRTPGWDEGLWILAMGFLGTIGQRAMTRAFAAADVSVVLPVDFTRLLFAAAIGFALFGEQPGIWTWIGGTVIFASTVFLARGEAKTGRASRGS
jgi:drug/metabolite transporter (DMT)-like permease